MWNKENKQSHGTLHVIWKVCEKGPIWVTCIRSKEQVRIRVKQSSEGGSGEEALMKWLFLLLLWFLCTHEFSYRLEHEPYRKLCGITYSIISFTLFALPNESNTFLLKCQSFWIQLFQIAIMTNSYYGSGE